MKISRRRLHKLAVELRRQARERKKRKAYRAKHGEPPKRPSSRFTLGNIFRVGEEKEVGEVLLTRVRRKPVDYWAENATGVSLVIRKLPKGKKGWDVLLPAGGVHTFHTLRDACEFVEQLVRMEEEEALQPEVVL